jgi:hypothetical protein
MENTSLSPPPVEAHARQKPSGTKRNKISRACDECRKRKVLSHRLLDTLYHSQRAALEISIQIYRQILTFYSLLNLHRLNVMVLSHAIAVASRTLHVSLSNQPHDVVLPNNM